MAAMRLEYIVKDNVCTTSIYDGSHVSTSTYKTTRKYRDGKYDDLFGFALITPDSALKKYVLDHQLEIQKGNMEYRGKNVY